MNYLRIRNWTTWQSYRKDRGQPPWIKVHRNLMRNMDWITLTDEQRGQLVSIWMLAADKDGLVPADSKLIQKLCFMESEPNLQVFMDGGFIHRDVKVASAWRQSDAPEERRGEEKRGEEKASPSPSQIEMLVGMATERNLSLDDFCKQAKLPLIRANVTAIKAALKAVPEPDPERLEIERKNAKLRELKKELDDLYASLPSDAPDWIRSNEKCFHGSLFGRLKELQDGPTRKVG